MRLRRRVVRSLSRWHAVHRLSSASTPHPRHIRRGGIATPTKNYALLDLLDAEVCASTSRTSPYRYKSRPVGNTLTGLSFPEVFQYDTNCFDTPSNFAAWAAVTCTSRFMVASHDKGPPGFEASGPQCQRIDRCRTWRFWSQR